MQTEPKKYRVNSDINMGKHAAGDVAEFSAEDAAPLLACGAISELVDSTTEEAATAEAERLAAEAKAKAEQEAAEAEKAAKAAAKANEKAAKEAAEAEAAKKAADEASAKANAKK